MKEKSMCPPSHSENAPRESGVSGQQHAAMEQKDERLFWFLCILNSMGGTSDASDGMYDWYQTFCGDRGNDDDTFNLALAKGYTRVTHNHDWDTSTVHLKDEGLAYVVRHMRCVSDGDRNGEDPKGLSGEAMPARSAQAETPENLRSEAERLTRERDAYLREYENCYRELQNVEARLQQMTKALAWTDQVYPEALPWGGAKVEMTWDEYNAMRELIGLKPRKPPRAALSTQGSDKDGSLRAQFERGEVDEIELDGSDD